MIIELFGLPGAGKTFFSKELQQKGWQVVKVKEKSELFLNNLEFLFRFPYYFFSQFFLVINNLGFINLIKYKLVNSFIGNNARFNIASKKGNFLLDQGYLQNAISLFDRKLSESEMIDIVKDIPKPDLLVILNIPKSLREERITKRGYGVRTSMPKEYVKFFLENSEHNFDVFLKVLNRININYVVYDETNKDEVFERISKINKLKIVYTTNVRLPTVKAHGLQVMKMAEAFSLAGVLEKLVIPNLSTDLGNPFEYYSVKNHFDIRRIFVLEILSLKKFIGRFAAYIQNLSFSISALIYLWWLGYLNGRYVVYSRDQFTLFILAFFNINFVAEIHDYRYQNRRWFFGLIMERARLVVANSVGTKDILFKHYQRDNILVASNGVDSEFFRVDKDVSEIRKELSIPNTLTIGYVGNINVAGVDKGVEQLINAFSLIESEHVQLYIVGGSVEQCNKLREEFSDVARLFIIPRVEYKLVPLYLKAFDVLVVPFGDPGHMNTTSPMKLFEYLASGRAILAPKILFDFIGNDSIYWFDQGSLLDGLNKLIADESLRLSLGNKALNESAKHSWLARAENIIKEI